MEQSKNLDKPLPVTDSDFNETVRKYPVVVVDFWAEWCPPCHMLAPVIEELANDYAGKVVFAKLNVDKNPKTANRFGIMSIPTLYFVKNGVVKDAVTGAVPRHIIEAKIKALM